MPVGCLTKPVSALPDLQRAFARHVRGEDDPQALAAVCGAELTPAARLGIYRNNLVGNLTEALAMDYPAVLRLVGEDFFEAAAARFIRMHPSTSGNLQHYGAGFADFLAALPQAAGVAYLPDVARLEWARQEALLAADAEVLAPAALADADANLRLALHPSVRLIASPHPILSLWLYCREEEPGEPPAMDNGERVLVVRPHEAVEMFALGVGEYTFLHACREGATLGIALTAAQASESGFDLAVCLKRHHEVGVFAAA
ncbi:MAG: DNA-binding domain-containing protein [Gammaproteobacteria bacterium]